MPDEREEDWSRWFIHDGNGCPRRVVWRHVQVVLMLACADEAGGAFGAERTDEGLITPEYAANPMWDHRNFGEMFTYITGPMAGRNFRCPLIVRYRIRRSSAFESLLRIAELPAKITETIEV